MKAIIYTQYGSPDVLQLTEMEKPAPKDNEVLVKIHATSVTATDCTFRKGEPFIGRLFAGLTKPKIPIPGTELAGEVEAVGRDVKHFKAGDQVFGTTAGQGGANAEYVTLPEDDATLFAKPKNLNFEEAVACDGALTALPFLRDAAQIQRGQRILINGASGSIGIAAVQLAKSFGAHVTGVCSTKNVELVRSMGADAVIDYTREDFTQTGQTYDIIFDTVGKTSFSHCKGSLKPDGIFIEAALTRTILPQVLWTSLVGRKKAKIAFTGLRPGSERTEDLKFIKQLMEAGQLKSVIDRRYPLEQIVEAHRYVETGHKAGNVVITVSQNGKR